MTTIADMRKEALIKFGRLRQEPEQPPPPFDIWEHDLGSSDQTPVDLRSATFRDPILVKGKKGIFIAIGKARVRKRDVRLLAWRTEMGGQPALQYDRIADLRRDIRVRDQLPNPDGDEE